MLIFFFVTACALVNLSDGQRLQLHTGSLGSQHGSTGTGSFGVGSYRNIHAGDVRDQLTPQRTVGTAAKENQLVNIAVGIPGFQHDPQLIGNAFHDSQGEVAPLGG